tara:strand:- start:638 stop:799 length:162 start_codon:yes stop_codon:yes gene_type:complete
LPKNRTQINALIEKNIIARLRSERKVSGYEILARCSAKSSQRKPGSKAFAKSA